MIKVSITGMVVSLKTDLRFPIPGQQGHEGRIIQHKTWKLPVPLQLLLISKEKYDEWRYKYPELDTYQKRAKIPSQELSDYLVKELTKKEK